MSNANRLPPDGTAGPTPEYAAASPDVERSPADPADRLGPSWRGARTIRLIALAVAVLFILWLARGVIGPFVVAAIVAYAFSPLVTAAESKTHLPRILIIAIGYVVTIAVLVVAGVLVWHRVAEEFRELSASGNGDVVAEALRRIVGNSVTIAGQTIAVTDASRAIRGAVFGTFSSPNDAIQMVEHGVDLALQTVLMFIVAFYLLLDGDRFVEFTLRFFDRRRRARTVRIGRRIHAVLGRWLRGQLFLIALVAVVLYLILGPILHIPYALGLALLSGVLEIIPLVGPIVAAALAVTVAFGTHGSDSAIIVLVVYFVLRQIEDQVVMPIVIGRAVHLHPVVTIFAVLVGLSAFGVLGGLLGVPVAAALNVTLHELYPAASGLPDEPPVTGKGKRNDAMPPRRAVGDATVKE